MREERRKGGGTEEKAVSRRWETSNFCFSKQGVCEVQTKETKPKDQIS